MSEKIRHTLLNHEVTPPPAVWQHIVAELEEMEELKQVRQQLLQAEAMPAPGNWSKIQEELSTLKIGKQLAAAEQQPPAGTWQKIAQELDTPSRSEVRKISPWWRYAAAAAILITAGLGVLRLAESSSDGEETAIHTDLNAAGNAGKKETIHTAPDEAVAISPASSEEARNDAALEESKKTYARLEYPARKIAREVSGFYFNSLTGEPGTRGLNIEETASAEVPEKARYITLMTPEGNIIRVSKKLGGLVCCISGEEEDPACTDQLKKWREKIVASSLGHTADNFMDLLQLVNAAEEN